MEQILFRGPNARAYRFGREAVGAPALPRAEQSDAEVLDAFEAIGDTCEFATVQKIAGMDRLALFKWSGPPLPVLAKLITNNLEGVDDLRNVRLRVEPRTQGPFEYMMYHLALHSPMHTFATVDEISEERLYERECRRMALLRRKFLEDARNARRVYLYRSLMPRDFADIVKVHTALRGHGPNRMLFVHPPTRDLAAGEARLVQPGLAVGALDKLATYEAATEILSAMWPTLLRRAIDVLQ